MGKQISLANLSEEDRKKLIEEARQQAEADERNIKEQRKAYKDLVDETIPAIFKGLVETSQQMAKVKKEVFDSVQTLIKMKCDVYDSKPDQHTHSFTTSTGVTVLLGFRMIDNWDDTVNEGIKKVKDFITSLSKDDNSAALVETVLNLLSKDKSGNLKASRVLQLKQLAEKVNNKEFTDAINIIQDAYKPTRSKEFISCRYTNHDGDKVDLPLDISAVDMKEPLRIPDNQYQKKQSEQ